MTCFRYGKIWHNITVFLQTGIIVVWRKYGKSRWIPWTVVVIYKTDVTRNSTWRIIIVNLAYNKPVGKNGGRIYVTFNLEDSGCMTKQLSILKPSALFQLFDPFHRKKWIKVRHQTEYFCGYRQKHSTSTHLARQFETLQLKCRDSVYDKYMNVFTESVALTGSSVKVKWRSG